MDRGQELCVGCGLPSVVMLNDRHLCGYCYFVAVSFRERQLSPGGVSEPVQDPPRGDLEHAVITAIAEIEALRRKVDELMGKLPKDDRPQ